MYKTCRLVLCTLFALSISGIANSATTSEIQDKVLQIYAGVWETVPDAQGLDYWTNTISSNQFTYVDVATSFFDQPLVKEKYSDGSGNLLTGEDMLAALYRNLFKIETPDEEGFNYWKAQVGLIPDVMVGEPTLLTSHIGTLILQFIDGMWANALAAETQNLYTNFTNAGRFFYEAQVAEGMLYSDMPSYQQYNFLAAARDFTAALDADITNTEIDALVVTAIEAILCATDACQAVEPDDDYDDDGYTEDQGDCDDSDALIYPGNLEIYDGIDNDCDGIVDNEFSAWYPDTDGDSFGSGAVKYATSKPQGYVSDNTDCVDTSASVYPGAPEVCGDSIDQNCSGADELCRIRTLTIDVLGDGNATSSTDSGLGCDENCEFDYTEGQYISLEATASVGSTFSHWTGCDDVTGATCTLTLDNDKYVSPSFAKPAIYTSATVELDATAMAELLAQSKTSLTFSQDIIGLVTFAPGDVLVSTVVTDVAEGLLRKVVSVEESGGQVNVETSMAMIEDVIHEGTLVSQTALSPENATVLSNARGVTISRAVVGSGFEFTLDHVLLDDDGDSGTEDDQLTLTGSFTAEITLDAGLDVGSSGIKAFKLIMNSSTTTDLTVGVSGTIGKKEIKKTLTTYTMPTPIVLGPVVIIPEIALIAKAKASVDAEVSAGVEIITELVGGVVYRKGYGWSPLGSFDTNFDFTAPTYQITVGAKASVGPQLTTKIYGLAGPSVSLLGSLGLNGGVSTGGETGYWCSLKAGISASAGAKFGISKWTLAEADFTLLEYEKPLFSCDNGLIPDNTNPYPPADLTISNLMSTSVSLSWGEAIDNVAISGYEIFKDGVLVETDIIATSYRVRRLDPSMSYCFEVQAYDAAGNRSPLSDEICATTPELTDTTPPGVPINMQASAGTNSREIALSWSAPPETDLSGYLINRNGELLEATQNEHFTDTAVLSDIEYCYTVIAYDAGGNWSPYSNEVCATTTDSAATYTMSGTLHSGSASGPTLSGVTVSIAGKTTTSSSNGTFTITGIPAGTYAFIVSKSGYDTYTNPAYNVSNNQSNLHFYLDLENPLLGTWVGPKGVKITITNPGIIVGQDQYFAGNIYCPSFPNGGIITISGGVNTTDYIRFSMSDIPELNYLLGTIVVDQSESLMFNNLRVDIINNSDSDTRLNGYMSYKYFDLRDYNNFKEDSFSGPVELIKQ